MARIEKCNGFNQLSIAAQIIDGSIKIDSTAEFENVLQIFPDDPALLRAYGDLLLVKNKPEDASKTFGKAARLFIDSGMILQAIVSKSLQWKINAPSDSGEIRLFFSEIKKAAYPVQTNGETVYKKSSIHLCENDFFGAVYPFEDKQLSQSYVETITQSELIKIPKINLMKICVKHPHVEKALVDLLGAQSGIEEKDDPLIDRVGARQEIPLKVHLQIHPRSDNEQPLSVSGYSKDISIGGICVVLNSEYRSIPSFEDCVKDAGVQITLPAEELSLNVKGAVVWSRRIKTGEDTTVAMGMRFQEMSPRSRGMLLGFTKNLEKLEGLNHKSI